MRIIGLFNVNNSAMNFFWKICSFHCAAPRSGPKAIDSAEWPFVCVILTSLCLLESTNRPINQIILIISINQWMFLWCNVGPTRETANQSSATAGALLYCTISLPSSRPTNHPPVCSDFYAQATAAAQL